MSLSFSKSLLAVALAAAHFSSFAADTYFHRTPAAAKCPASGCTVAGVSPTGSARTPNQPPSTPAPAPAPVAPGHATITSAQYVYDRGLGGNILVLLSRIGVSSAPKSFVVTNDGAGPLKITGMSLVADYESWSNHFQLTHNCGTLSPGASCTGTMTFTSTTKFESLVATVTVFHNGEGDNTVTGLGDTQQ